MRTMAPTTAALAVAVAVLAAGCVGSEGVDRAVQPAPARSSPASSPSAADRDPTQEETRMRIQITIGQRRLGATLDESPAAHDLLAQLPVTIDMTDHGGVEKTGPLPSPLSLDDQPDGADPDVGDLGYYAPGQDLVLCHGDQSFFPGIVVLGRLDADATRQIAEIDGSATVTVEAHDD